MSQIHDEIRESLQAYLGGTLIKETKDKVESHLKECSECRDELAIISELVKVEVPDTGELFWNSLPKKIRLAAEEKKAGWFSFRALVFRPLPIAAIIAIMIFLVFSHSKNRGVPSEPFTKDPLSASVMDCSDIKEEDIPEIDSAFEIAENYSSSEDIPENSYYSEVASLGPEELDRLNEILNKEDEKGG